MAMINLENQVPPPDVLLNAFPCVKCASESQLLQFLFYILCYVNADDIAGFPNTPLENSKCYTCLSDTQMLEAIVNILGNDILGQDVTGADVIEVMKCLQCVPPGKIKAGIVYEIIKFAQNDFNPAIR